MPDAPLATSLHHAPYVDSPTEEVTGLVGDLAKKLEAIEAAAGRFLALIDRAPDFLDMFVFFTDLDFSLSELKFAFADFEKTHYLWIRFLVLDDEIPEPTAVPDAPDDEPIRIDGGEFYREDPGWLAVQNRILHDLRRLLQKRGEVEAFWFFDDPFCDESYVEGEVSENVAEIYADLTEIRDRINLLRTEWNEEAYAHIQDLVEFHTTHHIMVLFRPIQYLIGKDL